MDNGIRQGKNRLAAWLVEQFYCGLAWCYDPLVWLLTTGLWYRWVNTAEQFIGQQPVLEIGCGRGHLLSRLAKRGLDVIGLDKSAAMARATRRRLDKNQLSAKVICADARSVPLPNASIGTIVSTFPGEYVLEQQIWAEYARLLRPDGRWILILGCEGFSFRTMLMNVAAFLEHLGRDKKFSNRVAELFPDDLINWVQVGPTRVPVMVLSCSRIQETLMVMQCSEKQP
jgi:SAM-dependent methyltransferase